MSERVDVDRLADYVGGALDGTPDEAEVRRLVTTDPEWAAAHEDLAAAMSSVGAGLHALGAEDTRVPEDVVARLDGVLRTFGSSAEAAPGGPLAAVDGARDDGGTLRPADAVGGHTGRSGGSADGAGSLGDDVARSEGDGDGLGPDAARSGGGRDTGGVRDIRDGRGGRGRGAPGGRGAVSGPGVTGGPNGASGPGRERRRRTARWAAGLSAAAAVVAFGIGVVATFPSDDDRATESAAGAPDAAAPAMAPATGTVASGRDYRAGSFQGLGDAAPAAPAISDQRTSRDQAKAEAVPPAAGPPAELARFGSPAAVEACLDAIRQTYGGVVRVVDLARYEGDPAVVVLLDGASTGGGRQLVVVAGPACGQLPGDTDEVFHGPGG